MKFIKLKGISINVEAIEAIEKIDEFHCRVITRDNTYTSDFPYQVMIDLLESGKTLEQDLKEIKNVVNTLGHFAG